MSHELLVGVTAYYCMLKQRAVLDIKAIAEVARLWETECLPNSGDLGYDIYHLILVGCLVRNTEQMEGIDSFPLSWIDYVAFGSYFIVLCAIGLWVGRKEKTDADDYFLAGRTLPWYVVGSSFIASNISSEHFIGMVGAAFVYGICVALSEWGNVLSFSVLIWLFIPFLLASHHPPSTA